MSEDIQALKGAALGCLQILDIKQMAEKEQDLRRRTLETIRAYKIWKRQYAEQTDVIELLYGNIEGVILRRQADDMIGRYWKLRRDFREAFKLYISQSVKFPPYSQAA